MFFRARFGGRGFILVLLPFMRCSLLRAVKAPPLPLPRTSLSSGFIASHAGCYLRESGWSLFPAPLYPQLATSQRPEIC